jgi:hypothetical protein
MKKYASIQSIERLQERISRLENGNFNPDLDEVQSQNHSSVRQFIIVNNLESFNHYRDRQKKIKIKISKLKFV